MPIRQPLSNRLDPAPGSNLAQVKTQQAARAEDERLRLRRLKGAVVLIEQFLLDQGYMQALQVLQQESMLPLSKYCVADNVDLLSVIGEFEELYEFKYQRKVKLFRLRGGDEDDAGLRVVTEAGEKVLVRKTRETKTSVPGPSPPSPAARVHRCTPPGNNDDADSVAAAGRPSLGQVRPLGGLARALGKMERHGEGGKPAVAASRADEAAAQKVGEGVQLAVDGQRVGDAATRGEDGECEASFGAGRALKPLPRFPTAELNELAGTILREIVDVNPAVHWNDIAELESAKHLLKEAVVMPVKYPELFEGIVRPWKGILLFGPPGTGKTLLAKAVATECRTTFFNISASSVVSKWRGDSEKLVRMLFDLAVYYAPSTIFIDEIDSIMSARSSEGEHEGSRRMKTELLTQMDGLSKRRGGEIVFVLAASNVPWDLDTAMLRRLEKRILVTLPTTQAREVMFRQLLRRHALAVAEGDFDWSACAALTQGMSGADIDVICREAMMRPIRKLIAQLEERGVGHDELAKTRLALPRVTLEDVRASVACTRSTVHQADLAKYDDWAEKYASGLSM